MDTLIAVTYLITNT